MLKPTHRQEQRHYKYRIYEETKLSHNLTDKTVSTVQFTFLCYSFA